MRTFYYYTIHFSTTIPILSAFHLYETMAVKDESNDNNSWKERGGMNGYTE